MMGPGEQGAKPRYRSSWISIRPFKNAWARLREEWAATPRAALARAGLILAVGGVACTVWSAAVSIAGKWLERRGMQAWDEQVLYWIEENDALGFTGAVLLESPGNAAYLVPLTMAVAVWSALRGRALAGVAVLVAYWGVRYLVGVGWAAWSRARPDLIAEGIAAPGFHSFPSGHTAMATAAYGLLAYLWIRASKSTSERLFAGTVTTLWVLVVGWARVRLGAHWPSDIPAGVAVGLSWVAVVIMALRAAENRRSSEVGSTSANGKANKS